MNAFCRKNVAEYKKLSWQTIKNWVTQDGVSYWFSPPNPPLFFLTPLPPQHPQNAQKAASNSISESSTTKDILTAAAETKGPWAVRGRRLAPPGFEPEVLAQCMELAATKVLQQATDLEGKKQKVLLVEIAASILYSYDIVKQAALSVSQEDKWRDNELVQKCVCTPHPHPHFFSTRSPIFSFNRLKFSPKWIYNVLKRHRLSRQRTTGMEKKDRPPPDEVQNIMAEIQKLILQEGLDLCDVWNADECVV